MEIIKPKTDEEKQAAAKAEYEKLLTMRSGGTYIPPARLRALQSQITDKSSKEYQRMAWEALKKSINGLINKVNISNIKHIVPELFGENLIRGRGLFCRSIMKAQAASLPFTPIYATMAAIVNTKLPNVGELLLKRLITQFKKGFKRNDKAVCLSATTFIAHLCNHQVANEVVAAQILLLLLHRPTDDSVEIAVGLTREVGQHLEEMNQVIALAVFDQFRNILHEADIDKRIQYMIEVLFQVRKDKYKDNPAIKEELDLVEEEDQITHVISLDDEIDVSEGLNVFKYDPDWEANEDKYNQTKAEIFGEASDSEEDEDCEDGDDSDDEEGEQEDKAIEIKDRSNADLVALRKTIYLTIMSSVDPEECCHKLRKVQLPGGLEHELPSMIIECCSQEKTYSKFFGLIGEQLSRINRLWTQLFEESFNKYYDTIHRYETNRLRNIARFFGHLLSSDAIGWHVFSIVHLNEEETTASSRIFIKILFEDLVEAMGMIKLQTRLKDDGLRTYFEGLFPKDNPRNTRFSINYFTSIKMGPLTEELREYLSNLPKQTLPAPVIGADRSGSISSSASSYSSCSRTSYSRSRSPPPKRSLRRNISPTPEKHPERTDNSSVGAISRGRASHKKIKSPIPKRGNSSSSRSPYRGRRSVSRSRSPYRRRTSLNQTKKPSRKRESFSSSRSPHRGRQSISRSRSPYRRRSSLSPSRTPPPRREKGSPSRSPRRGRQSISRSRSPYRRRSSLSPSRTPPLRREKSSPSTSPRRGRRSISRSRSPYRKRPSYSLSRSPHRRRGKSSPSQSPHRGRSIRRSKSSAQRRPSYSVSRSPPRRRANSSSSRSPHRGRRSVRRSRSLYRSSRSRSMSRSTSRKRQPTKVQSLTKTTARKNRHSLTPTKNSRPDSTYSTSRSPSRRRKPRMETRPRSPISKRHRNYSDSRSPPPKRGRRR
ncbi:pre-mRNA-splicing factor [Blumeria hordei DH14]|uniref:Pre-mRNA-splicing factor CWC22 n=1 Tax=Blumeria graminis f. sp. hordei (strain DH14) TaxID=546991 RepID=N1JCN4_BLUG1|nr:pre-mRNA-splicing factor [Blumeria hordei DH14]